MAVFVGVFLEVCGVFVECLWSVCGCLLGFLGGCLNGCLCGV